MHELDLTKEKAHKFLLFNYTLSQDLNHHAYLLANHLINFEFLSWLTTPGLRKDIWSHMYLYWHQHPMRQKATCTLDSQPGDCRWSLDLTQVIVSPCIG